VAHQHGFHDDYHSSAHYMMLVLSEIGEMVEADRKNRHADVGMFKELEKVRIGSDEEYASYVNKCFVEHVKDTLEDEMADVVIRLCDFCGSLNVLPYTNDVMVDMSEEFAKFWGDKSVCEQCFALSSMVVDVERASYDADDTEMCKRLGSTLSYIFEMAHFHGIDLLWHVDRKMEYNESRPRRHGKAY
jgi:NTP pyrophosphatase (non-canonical NTP hydrolase)